MTAGPPARDRWILAVLLGLSALHPALSIVDPLRGLVVEPGDDPEPTREPVPA